MEVSCGFVQNPLIPFKSVFLVNLRDEEAFLSYNLKQCPAARRKLRRLPMAAGSADAQHPTAAEALALKVTECRRGTGAGEVGGAGGRDAAAVRDVRDGRRTLPGALPARA